ncbi:ABC transporter permease [Curvibacter sp. CHRR-16]|uniref:ABC transporter permease n=1 Tax=Curvibacter sp. CHRR-16 TaxID=2835872 RepID=UPI001BDA6D10|nr:ABC transporter permease [Curvibacter sp. CHRR-16]MBT0569762.1 ABC transporter permease [Curvibacter sp. CHRR-16]
MSSHKSAKTSASAPWKKQALRLWRHRPVRYSTALLLFVVVLVVGAPLFGTISPDAIDPSNANLPWWTVAVFNDLSGDSFEHRFLLGTDAMGRDLWSRMLYGGRVSLTVGVVVACLSIVLGSLVGLVSGYFRRVDAVIMRCMDGLMAIPAMLFAISLVAIFGAHLSTLLVAITIPEIPRVARLVRSVVLSVREEAYVEAAVALATPTIKILRKHILPNAMAPLIIQGTYICAAAILIESSLSFLGLGLSAEQATWGSIMAEGRSQFNQYPQVVLLPGTLLALTVLSVNMLGDALRDKLDPKFNKRT